MVHSDISEIINSNCWLAEDKLVSKWAVKVGSYSLQVESKIFFSLLLRKKQNQNQIVHYH